MMEVQTTVGEGLHEWLGTLHTKETDVSVISILLCWEELALIEYKAGNRNVERTLVMEHMGQLSSAVKMVSNNWTKGLFSGLCVATGQTQ